MIKIHDTIVDGRKDNIVESCSLDDERLTFYLKNGQQVIYWKRFEDLNINNLDDLYLHYQKNWRNLYDNNYDNNKVKEDGGWILIPKESLKEAIHWHGSHINNLWDDKEINKSLEHLYILEKILGGG